jgi:hypothetical protein
MYKNFKLPGRQNRSIKGTPLPRTVDIEETPWYVIGIRRRLGLKKLEFALAYGNAEITYKGLELTYTKAVS